MRRGAARSAAFFGLVLASSLATSLPASNARAQTGPRATVGLSVGYNSIYTPFSFPTTTSAQGPFGTVAASVGDTLQTQRTTNSITASFGTYLPLNQSFQFTQNPVRYNTALKYIGNYELTPRLRMFDGVGAALIPLNTFNPNAGPVTSQLAATPTGYSYNFLGTGTLGLTERVSPKGTITWAEHFNSTLPINTNPIAARVYHLDSSLSYSTNFSLERFKLQGGSSYVHFDISESSSGGVIDPRTAYLNRLLLSWSHLWLPTLTSTIKAGVLNVLTDTSVVGTSFWQPNGGAQVLYSPLYGQAALTYTHVGGINPVTAQVTLNDQVTLRGSMPLGTTDLFLIGTGGYAKTQAISTAGVLVSPIDVWLFDFGVTWRPRRVPRLAIGVRHSWRQQTPTQNPTGAFTQQISVLTLTYAYPNALLVTQATGMPDDLDESGLTPEETGEVPVGVDEDATPESDEATSPNNTTQNPNAQPGASSAPAAAPAAKP